MKIITFVVPCYNSSAYMDHCIQSILPGGTDIEIILVNDGSSDDTGLICDRYQSQYPDIIRVIHQENGGHGEGVNQGLRHAKGLFFKVVDSDDWLSHAALEQLLKQIRTFIAQNQAVDMIICNYVYEKVEENSRRVMKYTNVMPQNTLFTWEDCKRFQPSQYILMHSVIYRTKILRKSGLILPKHTFYVDNLFVYQPLPYVKKLYYMDIDLYRYFIGRADQSVNQQIMIKRVEQQLFVTNTMRKLHTFRSLLKKKPKLGRYMLNYLSMMFSITSILLLLDGTPEKEQLRLDLWQELKQGDPYLYFKVKYQTIAFWTSLKSNLGKKVAVRLYNWAQKRYHFN